MIPIHMFYSFTQIHISLKTAFQATTISSPYFDPLRMEMRMRRSSCQGQRQARQNLQRRLQTDEEIAADYGEQSLAHYINTQDMPI